MSLLEETAEIQIVLRFDFLCANADFSNNTFIYQKFFNIKQITKEYFLNLYV